MMKYIAVVLALLVAACMAQVGDKEITVEQTLSLASTAYVNYHTQICENFNALADKDEEAVKELVKSVSQDVRDTATEYLKDIVSSSGADTTGAQASFAEKIFGIANHMLMDVFAQYRVEGSSIDDLVANACSGGDIVAPSSSKYEAQAGAITHWWNRPIQSAAEL